ncbi:MAG: DUF4864 domain-containing protein [Pseudomonadota bacterium]
MTRNIADIAPMSHPFIARFIAFAAAIVVAVGVALPRPAAAQDAAIVAVIEDQLAAFQRNDLDAAFAHAAPQIQRKFGSPENFGHMVRHGYPMIWRPSRYEYRGLEEPESGFFVKTVLFEDAAGQQFEADYIMGLTEGEWRIRGVSLRKLPGVSS